MTERATIFTTVQVGAEGTATPGTAVAASKQLSGLAIEPGAQVDITPYRPTGSKFPTVASFNREWVEASLSGPVTYTEIIYPLSSVLVNTTPTGGGTAKTWTFTPAQTAADLSRTFTVEQGSTERAHRFTYGLVTEFGMTFSTTGCEVEGTMLGKALTDGITLTGTPTAIALVPVFPKHVSVMLEDTMAALGTATAKSRVISVSWRISDRYGPVWVLNQSTTWAAHVELEPNLEVTLLLEADAEGMALLTTMRAASTKFMRISATSDEIIGGGTPYLMTIDTALKIMDVSEFRDEDGIFAIEWTARGFYDTTSGKATEIAVRNALTAL